MDELTSSQRKHLRGLAHGLEPVVQIGKQGLTAGTLAQVDQALAVHELVKVRFVGSKDEKREILAEAASHLGAHQVGTIGHVGILYRRHAEPEKRKIRLP